MKGVVKGLLAGRGPSALRDLPTRRVLRLKPVTARIARWAGWFLAAGWPLETTADLFGVDPDGLEAMLGVSA